MEKVDESLKFIREIGVSQKDEGSLVFYESFIDKDPLLDYCLPKDGNGDAKKNSSLWFYRRIISIQSSNQSSFRFWYENGKSVCVQ